MFTQLSELLPKALRKAGVYDPILSGQVMNDAKNFFENISPDIEVEGQKVQNQKIYLKLKNSVIMHVCYQKKHECLEYLANKGYEVYDIIFRQ